MNQELIDMAKQAGGYVSLSYEHEGKLILSGEDIVQKFAALVAAAEREACAKVCDELPAPDIYSDTDKSMWEVTCMDCSEAIRARGETK